MTVYRIFLSVAIFLAGSTLALGQDPYEVETRPPRGFMPATDHLSSPVDSIEPTTGKLHLEIPLASLPAGRGGSGFDLNLVYDSHIYNLEPEILQPTTQEYLSYGPMPAWRLSAEWPNTGWNYSIENIRLEPEFRNDATQDYPCDDTDANRRPWRLRIGLPDGSLHQLFLLGWESYNWREGFYGMNYNGKSTLCSSWLEQSQNQYIGPLTYYTIDGSYLKLETYADGTDFPSWTLYFPDGRRIVYLPATQSEPPYIDLHDANGNKHRIASACYDPLPEGDCSLPYQSIVDDAGREIRINFNVEDLPNGGLFAGRTDTITAEGANGTMTWTVNWQAFELGQGREYIWSAAPWDLYESLYASLHVVKYVQLPMAAAVGSGQTPPEWNSYAFGYSDDADQGWGEVDSVRTPSGALFQYRYTMEGTTPESEVIANFNSVSERRISHDGPDLVWEYNLISFDRMTITNPDSSETVYRFNPPGGYLAEAYPFGAVGNKVYRIDEPNGNVVKRVWANNRVPQWNVSELSAHNSYVARETRTIGDESSAPSKTLVTDRMIDKNGNLLQTTEYDWVAFSSTDPETGSAPRRITDFNYYAETPAATASSDDPQAYWNAHFSPLAPGAARRLDAVQRRTVSDGGGNPKSATEFVYDNEFGAGNVTAEKRWDHDESASLPALGGLDAASAQIWTRSYGAYGNLEEITEPKNNLSKEIKTHITYDATGSFPERVDYAYGEDEERSWTYTWHSASGTLESKEDFYNNLTTSYTHDTVGRVLTVNEAGVRKTETIYDDELRKVTVKRDLASFGDGKLETITEYDKLGRAVLTSAREPGDPGWIYVKTTHYPTAASPTVWNRVVQSSPYRTTNDTTLQWTCTQSDSSKRVTAVAVFKGSVEPTDCESTTNRTAIARTSYDAEMTTLTDAASKARQEIRDSLGRLVQVVEDPSGLNYSTSYAYDTLDNLTEVTQGARTRAFEYNSLSLLKSADNPESGTTLYTYFDTGELETRTDARGITVGFTYDSLHRITGKTYSDATPDVTYAYYLSGSPSPRVGQLESVSSSAASSSYTNYDALGRVTGSSHTIDGHSSTFPFSYAYWLNDAVKTITNPSGRVINYDVDDAGRTVQVDSGGTIYADLTGSTSAYTADGRIAAMKLGNNLWDTRSHDAYLPAESRILTAFKLGTTSGAGDKLELQYNFSSTANNGNLQGHIIQQPGNTWTQTFTYDGVNRLSTAAESGGWSQTFDYDRYGNLWVSASSGTGYSDAHEPTASSNYPAANNRLSVNGATYDDAGNQTFFNPFTLGYDAENRNTSAFDSASSNGTFFYDGDGKRVKKVWTTGSTTTTTFYVYNALGQLAAEYSTAPPPTTGTVYIHSDMLGSTRMMTDSTGAVLECYDYFPFGRLVTSNVNSRNTGCYPPDLTSQFSSNAAQRFTGKERDAETRLDFFGARYYSAAQGRFTGPDIEGPDLTNPQTLNKYRYALNNPLRYIDPNGLYEKDVHRGLTLVLALASGINSTTAQKIAAANQGVDDSPATSPMRIIGGTEARRLYHFTTSERRNDLWSAFEAQGTAEALGTFFHAQQDSFSHEGFGPRLGQAWPPWTGTTPDKTYNDPAKADKMARDTFDKMIDAKGHLNPQYGVHRKAIDWDIISPLVRKFNRAKKDSDKDKLLQQLRDLLGVWGDDQ